MPRMPVILTATFESLNTEGRPYLKTYQKRFASRRQAEHYADLWRYADRSHREPTIRSLEIDGVPYPPPCL